MAFAKCPEVPVLLFSSNTIRKGLLTASTTTTTSDRLRVAFVGYFLAPIILGPIKAQDPSLHVNEHDKTRT
jgi:hypothetical protein